MTIRTNHRAAFVLLVLLAATFSILSPHFLTVKTISALANQIPGITIVAVGMTFVILVGGIDLSVGSVMALSSVGYATALVSWNFSVLGAVGFALLVGTLCGAVNGAIVARWRVPSFIVTLAMLEMARGAAYYFAESRTIYVGARVSWTNLPVLGFLPFAFLLSLGIVVASHIIIQHTVFGRYVVGVGTNDSAMRLSGIDPSVVRTVVFAVAGLTAATAAIIETGRLEAADPNAGIGLELQVIAAVVIGGTSLLGGRGSVIATLVGVLIISILETGLAQLGTSEPLKRVLTGAVIVVAVAIDISRARLPALRQARQSPR